MTLVGGSIALLETPLPVSSVTANPDSMCYDRLHMDVHVRDVSTFLAGSRAVIDQTTRYLPRFPRELDEDYQNRLDVAKFTNVFRDLLDNLASKPFARTVDLSEDSRKRWPELAAFAENVDGAGNHLHVVAGDLFFNAIAYTVDWLIVDKSPIRPGASLAEEKKEGAKVYWYRVPQTDMLAVYSDIVDGQEIFTHFRFRETVLRRDGFGETVVERVRVFDRQKLPSSTETRPKYGPAYWQVYEMIPGSNGTASTWALIDQGMVGLGFIPLIPVTTGRRQGRSWRFVKTMDDVVHLQRKLYQAETNLEYAKMMVGSPMLSAVDASPPMVKRKVTMNGVDQLIEEPAPVIVGPKTVLYGDWKYVEIDSNALRFLNEDVQRCERQMREIGRQPLTSDSGNLTVVTTMFAAQKGNSAVQAWALGLKDSLELAMDYTARWMRLDGAQPEVNVWTDFSIDLESEAAPEFLKDAQTRGLMSRESYLAEGKRRNYLSAEYDSSTDIEKVVAERSKYDFLKATPADEKKEVGPGIGSGASGGNSA